MPDPAVLAAATAVAAGVGATAGLLTGRFVRRRQAEEAAERRREEALRERHDAEVAARRVRLDAELAAREEASARRRQAEAELREREAAVARAEAEVAAHETVLAAGRAKVAELRSGLDAAGARARARQEEAKTHAAAAARALPEARALLERVSGERAEALRAAMVEAESEAARASASQLLRHVDHSVSDPETTRRAKRVMGISIGRFEGHYLTERHQSTVLLGEPRDGRPLLSEEALAAVGEVSGVRLTLSESLDSVRLEGLDGVGREVARRALSRLLRRAPGSLDDVRAVTREMATQLDREVVELGRKAFATLQIPRPHADIVKLVGRLNWRTSYTQNQWKHAIEAAFLCGMMADELGLDLKLARRAALMHDIGKALTHELDGSHAVIGADYARRLGEQEVVANAIGAHHTDEPFGSAYAYLVAAADAMSGARPGARRQTEDNFVAKIADLERITRGFRGVAEAFAVQGGREVRVYVNEERIDDLGAIKLSSEIADAISREMTFPGQIKVTVIRELVAVEQAG